MQLMPLSVCGQAKSICHKAGGNEHGQHAGKETASIAAASPAGGPQDCPSEKDTRPIAEPPVQGNERKSRLTKNRCNRVVCRMRDGVASRFRKRCARHNRSPSGVGKWRTVWRCSRKTSPPMRTFAGKFCGAGYPMGLRSTVLRRIPGSYPRV